MVEHDVRWHRQRVVKEALRDDVGLSLLVGDSTTELLVVQRDLVSLHEVVIKMDRQHLSILNYFLSFVRQILMIDVLLSVLWLVATARARSTMTRSLVARLN